MNIKSSVNRQPTRSQSQSREAAAGEARDTPSSSRVSSHSTPTLRRLRAISTSSATPLLENAEMALSPC